MPLLLYAVTEGDGAAADLPPGAAGASVRSVKISGLTCFYSDSTLAASDTRATALEFHQVVNSLLQAADIIPFRFPTLLADTTEMASEIERHAAEYHDGLARIRGRVQIEIRIRFRGHDDKDGTRAAAKSGVEYLRRRHHHHIQLTSAAEALRAAGGALIEGWREREYSDHLRCFALIARGSFARLQDALAGAAIPSHLLVRVSGPWAATEFLKGIDDET